jgi:hypothetical protein
MAALCSFAQAVVELIRHVDRDLSGGHGLPSCAASIVARGT